MNPEPGSSASASPGPSSMAWASSWPMLPHSLKGADGAHNSSVLNILLERRRTAYRNFRRHCGMDRRTGDEPAGHDKRLYLRGFGLQHEHFHPILSGCGNDVWHLCGSGSGHPASEFHLAAVPQFWPGHRAGGGGPLEADLSHHPIHGAGLFLPGHRRLGAEDWRYTL